MQPGLVTLNLAPQTVDYLLHLASRQPWLEAHPHIQAVQMQIEQSNAAQADAGAASIRQDLIAAGTFEHDGKSYEVVPRASGAK